MGRHGVPPCHVQRSQRDPANAGANLLGRRQRARLGVHPRCRCITRGTVQLYNDFGINFTHIALLASTNAVGFANGAVSRSLAVTLLGDS